MLHQWVDTQYPGTKISISEYGWGDPKQLPDAIAEADVLGIFARERLDLACLWYTPKAADPMANSFRIYRNYDGRGGSFGDTSVRSLSDDQGRLSLYAALRTSDGALTVVAINKTNDALASHVKRSDDRPALSAAAYRFGRDSPTVLATLPHQPVAAGSRSFCRASQ